MGLIVDPYTFANGPGNVADAEQVNERFERLYALVNGELDDANIEPKSLTEASIADEGLTGALFADGAIPVAKLASAPAPPHDIGTGGGTTIGNGSLEVQVSHDLGVVPGIVLVEQTSGMTAHTQHEVFAKTSTYVWVRFFTGVASWQITFDWIAYPPVS